MSVKYLTPEELEEDNKRLRAEKPWLFDAASWEEARKERERQENQPPNPYKWPTKADGVEPGKTD
jgi:hypothetical protein